jgi:hypothetical protein
VWDGELGVPPDGESAPVPGAAAGSAGPGAGVRAGWL